MLSFPGALKWTEKSRLVSSSLQSEGLTFCPTLRSRDIPRISINQKLKEENVQQQTIFQSVTAPFKILFSFYPQLTLKYSYRAQTTPYRF